jgi:hypothetical protein
MRLQQQPPMQLPMLPLADVAESAAATTLAAGLAESVICVAESTLAIVVPTAMPSPSTVMPARRSAVLASVTVAAAMERLPLAATCRPVSVKTRETPAAVRSLYATESVTCVAESTDFTVVPETMPAPVTVMPGCSPAVVARFVTTAEAFARSPVVATRAGPASDAMLPANHCPLQTTHTYDKHT